MTFLGVYAGKNLNIEVHGPVKSSKNRKENSIPEDNNAVSWTDSLSTAEEQTWHRRNNTHKEYLVALNIYQTYQQSNSSKQLTVTNSIIRQYIITHSLPEGSKTPRSQEHQEHESPTETRKEEEEEAYQVRVFCCEHAHIIIIIIIKIACITTKAKRKTQFFFPIAKPTNVYMNWKNKTFKFQWKTNHEMNKIKQKTKRANLVNKLFMLPGLFGNFRSLFRQDLFGLVRLFWHHLLRLIHFLNKKQSICLKRQNNQNH